MPSEVQYLVHKETRLIILVGMFGLGGMVLWSAVSWWINKIATLVGNLQY